MKAGDTITLYIGRQTAAGLPAYTRTVSDFVVSRQGVLLTPSAFTEIGVPNGSAWAFYSMQVSDTGGNGAREYLIEPANNGNVSDVILGGLWSGALEVNDIDALSNLLLLNQGIPSVVSAADSNLGDFVDGDSFLTPTLTMPAGKLAPFGITDITAGGITVEAAVMDVPGGTSYPITVTVVSGTGLTFTLGWVAQPFPALAATANSRAWYIDVQVIKSGAPNKIITTNRYSFNAVWQRDTRVA